MTSIDTRVNEQLETRVIKIENDVEKLGAAEWSMEVKVIGEGKDLQQTTSSVKQPKGKKINVCDICGKKFAKKSSMVSHQVTHTGETPYHCEFCNKGFNVRSNLNVHMRIHTGQRPHYCELCDKSFRQAGQLKYHMRIHLGEKPYQCQWCDHAFRNSSGLITHQRTHTGEKPFSCDVCQRSFSTSTSLKTHRVTHSGKMLFECPVCGREFNRKNNLNVHIKRHEKNRKFSCPVCNHGFVMRAHVLKHLQLVHDIGKNESQKRYKWLFENLQQNRSANKMESERDARDGSHTEQNVMDLSFKPLKVESKDAEKENNKKDLDNNLKKELTVEDHSFDLELSASGHVEETVKETCNKMELHVEEARDENICGQPDKNSMKRVQDELPEGKSVTDNNNFKVCTRVVHVDANSRYQRTNEEYMVSENDGHKSVLSDARTQLCGFPIKIETDVAIKQEPLDDPSSPSMESDFINMSVGDMAPVAVKCEANLVE